MTEHTLDRPQSGAAAEHVAGKAMAQRMRGDRLLNASASGPILYDELKAAGGEPLTIPEVKKHRLR
jgi:hypothetical protein